MAVLIYLHRSTETGSLIQYSFGPTKTSQDQTLTIDKSTLSTVDHLSNPTATRATVAGWVLSRHRRHNQWPENGVIQS